MNKSSSSSLSLSVSRANSLLHRLKNAPLPEDGSASYLDQLMIFLDDPPTDVRDRWKQGAEMCGAWGFATTGPSVWRLYQSHVIYWRLHLAEEAASAASLLPGDFDFKLAHITERRLFEALTGSQLPPNHLVRLGSLALRICDHKRKNRSNAQVRSFLSDL